MNHEQHNQVITNMTRYLAEIIEDAQDKVLDKFIEVVGSGNLKKWEKEGYDVLDISTPSSILQPDELMRNTLVLRRGGKIITAFQITVSTDRKETKVITKNLSKKETQELLGRVPSSHKQ